MTEWPLTNPLSTNVTSSLHNHERWKTSLNSWLKFRTTCHKPLNWKTFIQSPPKIFQSVVWNVECRDRLEGMQDTASFGKLQKSPEYFRHCSKVVEIFFGNADKMHTKVSLLRLRKREQFSVVLFAFLETRREFYWRRNLTRDCFWDCYWGRTGQLLANLFLCP